MEKNTQKQTRYIPVTKWSEHHVYPPLGGMRHLIFNADRNGFANCIVRVGRRVLIDEQAFFQWLESKKSESCTK